MKMRRQWSSSREEMLMGVLQRFWFLSLFHNEGKRRWSRERERDQESRPAPFLLVICVVALRGNRAEIWSSRTFVYFPSALTT